MHDAAVAAWGIKGHYDYCDRSRTSAVCGAGNRAIRVGRRITRKESLVDGLIEVITEETGRGRSPPPPDRQPAARPVRRSDHDPDGEFMYYGEVGDIAIRSWRGTPDDPRRRSAVSGGSWALIGFRTNCRPSSAGVRRICIRAQHVQRAAQRCSADHRERVPGGQASYTLPRDGCTSRTGRVKM